MNLFKASATIGAFTFLSRLTGLARDMLMASILGTGMVADAFFVAFKLPSLFRRLFAEGAFSSAFVPIFSSLLRRDGRDAARHAEGVLAARRFAEEALAALALVLLALLAIFEIFMPWLMLGLAPGFVSDPPKFDLAVELTRITFPYLVFVSLVSLMGGVLNSLGRFAAQAAAPILLNVALVGVLLIFRDHIAANGHALAWGVFAAGVLQLGGMLFACWRAGFVLRPRWPRLTQPVRELGRLLVPGVIGSSAAQVNIAVDIIIASLLPTGSVSYLFYADRLVQLPLGAVGVAVGTALLPLLARQLSAGDQSGAMHSLNRAIELVLLLCVPATVALMIAGQPIVEVLFERDQFTAASTSATAAAVVAFAVGLPAYVLIKALSPAFFARKDTRTPVQVAVFALALNVVLNLALMGPLLHVGLALATALSAWVNAIALALILRRRGHLTFDARLVRSAWRGAIAVAIMGAAVWAAVAYAPPDVFDGDGVSQWLGLAVIVALGLGVYGLALQLLGVATLGDLRQMARRPKG